MTVDHDAGRPAEPLPSPADRAFVAAQQHYWREADAAHFEWQTRGPVIAAGEAALLDRVTAAPGARLLEVGCGEGGNLFHLAARLPGVRLFGVDFSAEKARFAALHTGAVTAAADAAHLPFAAAAFDAVLIRDILHHLPASARPAALAEAARVLRPGGALFVVEPNGLAPLIAAAALANPAERGMLPSRARGLEAEVRAAGLDVVAVERRQPMPISRVVLHYKMGLPRLGDRRAARALLEGFERALAAVVPRALWAYVVVCGRKP